MSDIRLHIQPEVCAALGKTPEELADMNICAFAALCFDKGFDLSVSTEKIREGKAGKLTVTMDRLQSVTTT